MVKVLRYFFSCGFTSFKQLVDIISMKNFLKPCLINPLEHQQTNLLKQFSINLPLITTIFFSNSSFPLYLNFHQGQIKIKYANPFPSFLNLRQ
jgi:hypothetical protein